MTAHTSPYGGAQGDVGGGGAGGAVGAKGAQGRCSWRGGVPPAHVAVGDPTESGRLPPHCPPVRQANQHHGLVPAAPPPPYGPCRGGWRTGPAAARGRGCREVHRRGHAGEGCRAAGEAAAAARHGTGQGPSAP